MEMIFEMTIISKYNASPVYSLLNEMITKKYFHGCDTHPDMEEQQQMAMELSVYIKQLMNW